MKRDILAKSREKRRKKFLLKILAFFILFLILVAGIVVTFYVDYFKIKNISISGNSFIGAETLRLNIGESLDGKYFYLFPKSNIFLASKEEIKNHLLENFHRIKSVSVRKDLPDSILVEVKERKPETLFCKDYNCAFIDEEGYIFEESPFFSGKIYLKFFDEREGNFFSIKKQLLALEEYKKLLDFTNLLINDNIEITEIVLKKDGIYHLKSDEGWYLILNNSNNPESAYNNLKLTLETQIKEMRRGLEYIDLRLPNKVFYKFKL
ncbi:MAG: FtsQ-type POTRA domain-containing protein [Patescibacteria group bacterium]